MRAWRCGARRGAAQQHTAVRHLAQPLNRHARAQVGDKSDEGAFKQTETEAGIQRSRDRGREEGQGGEQKHIGSHQPSPEQNKNNVQAASPRPHTRPHGLLFLPPSLPLALSSLFLFLPSASSATTNLWTADKSRPSLRAAMHTQKCIVSKWCDAPLVNGRFLSLASTLCVCVLLLLFDVVH